MSRRNKFFLFISVSAIIFFAYGFFVRLRALPLKGRIVTKGMLSSGANEPGFVYDAHEKRNPFLPLVSDDGRLLESQLTKKTSGEICVEGIIYDPAGFSCAVINGEIVKAGEAVGDYQLIRIEPQKIILLKDGKESEIELKKED